MEILNSSLINSTVKIAYSPSQYDGKRYSYKYWSLKNVITISSVSEFKSGDTVRILNIDYKNNEINVEPVTDSVDTNSILICTSNDVPLSDLDVYKFWYHGCDLVLSCESKMEGNKIYSFLVLAHTDIAQIKGYCRDSNTRISFQIFNK